MILLVIVVVLFAVCMVQAAVACRPEKIPYFCETMDYPELDDATREALRKYVLECNPPDGVWP